MYRIVLTSILGEGEVNIVTSGYLSRQLYGISRFNGSLLLGTNRGRDLLSSGPAQRFPGGIYLDIVAKKGWGARQILGPSLTQNGSPFVLNPTEGNSSRNSGGNYLHSMETM